MEEHLMSAPAKSGQMTAIAHIISLVKAFRDVDPEFPIQQIEALLWISMRPGISTRELCDLTGLAQASVSRNIAALGLVHRKGIPGKDFVTSESDPLEARRMVYFLTNKGRAFMAGLLSKVDPSLQFETPSYRQYVSTVTGRRFAPA
jgi:DNA-binding MarR family transcriptional regulator